MNKLGISAVFGVILMVAMVIAIASTVYVYITGMIYPNNEDCFSGQIIDKFRGIDYNNVYYYFTVENETCNCKQTIKDIQVNETIFYNYEIGNYYNCNDIRR